MEKPTIYPVVLNTDLTKDCVDLLIRIPGDLLYLTGHFPEMPVVAGVVQVHWAVHFAGKIFGICDLVSDVSKLKFSNLMRPDDCLTLRLKHDTDKQLISYTYYNDNLNYSSGCFNYTDKVGSDVL